MAKSIEINYNNSTGYEVLYPQTNMANIVDWTDNVYSKSDVYTKTETYTQAQVDTLIANAGGSQIVYGSYTPTEDNGTISIALSKSNPRYIICSIDEDYWVTSSNENAFLNCVSIFDLTSSTSISNLRRVYIAWGHYGSTGNTTLIGKFCFTITKTSNALSLKTSVLYQGANSWGIYSKSATAVSATEAISPAPFTTSGGKVNYALLYT